MPRPLPATVLPLAPVLTAVLVAGCAADADRAPAATASLSSAAPSAPAPTGPEPPQPALTSPGAEQLERLVELAGGIDPRLAENRDALARRADSVCLDLQEGEDPATVVSDVQRRFSGGGVEGLTEEQAAQLVEAVRTTVCP
ncbi:DUF732 domain-containing protein [Kineococcus arenarius]|uniref:DUF732 domain-containing protein n=1 Tax=Kineococcus sp. SYSU DK007 TaxID=3383128 RepID=UPI003D7DB0E4